MTAPIAKNQLSYTLGNMSYIGSSYDDASVAPAAQPRQGFGRWLVQWFAGFKEWQRKQTVLREMETMTDRELADIGLARGDLPRVFDPAFASDHARGRDYIAY
jgi:uncharacterized protein YjiS (DUF1127 family)